MVRIAVSGDDEPVVLAGAVEFDARFVLIVLLGLLILSTAWVGLVVVGGRLALEAGRGSVAALCGWLIAAAIAVAPPIAVGSAASYAVAAAVLLTHLVLFVVGCEVSRQEGQPGRRRVTRAGARRGPRPG